MEVVASRSEKQTDSIGPSRMIKQSKSTKPALLLVLLLTACNGRSSATPVVPTTTQPTRAEPLQPLVVEKIEKFCGDCHGLPIPSTFPKSRWPDEVRRGFEFYVETNRTDLPEPLRQDVIRYYQAAAPEEVVVPRADLEPAQPAPIELKPATLQVKLTVESSVLPAISQVQGLPGSNDLIFADMSGGGLWKWQPGSPDNTPAELLYKGKNICKASRCDWNNDSIDDYLVAEMGAFPVGDHQLGSITLLLGKPQGGFGPVELATGLSRVVEAQAIDYDEDGDMDVLVADFGWHKTGALRLLRNSGSKGAPQMKVEIVENKHGALGVEIADINQDNHLDFIVAYGQEYETIEVNLRKGPGEYEHQTIDRLKDPSYNASSFHLRDVDGDGRLDIVHTCGDTMDSMLAKPYHGVRWIHNLGDNRWEAHELGLLVGALNATSADFDGDGDIDIAAVGLFPDAPRSGPGAYNSVCWWEQREKLTFVQHTIERDTCTHAACTAQDANGDGRIDLVVGQWQSQDQSALRVFLNSPHAVKETSR